MFEERPKGAYNPECLLSTEKSGGGCVTIWAAMSWYSAGPIITMNVRITASDYVDILGNHVHPMVQMLFTNRDVFFQNDYSLIHTAGSVQSWFEEHEDAFQHLPCSEKLPVLYIIETLGQF